MNAQRETVLGNRTQLEMMYVENKHVRISAMQTTVTQRWCGTDKEQIAC